MTTFIYARNREHLSTTYVVETTIKEYVALAKQKRKCGYQIGVLGGRDLATVSRVYREYAPYKKVASIEELIKIMED